MIEICKDLFWVGIKDWELKKFHGDEFTTENGSTYNSYIIKGTEKTVLVDTCWGPFKEAYIENLEQTIGLANIDALICQHTESDHSGAMMALLEKRPDLPIYCTAMGKSFLHSQYPREWNCTTVKTGDKLDIGGYTLLFIEAPMLHWPDSMFTYVMGMEALLPNDAFGQHYVTGSLYNDEVDQCVLWQEAMKYFANIVAPYAKMVRPKIDQFKALGLPLSLICPSHGVIWRENPMQIVDKYDEWAGEYKEDQVVILYDTMWLETRAMAEALGRGVTKAGMSAKVINAARTDVTHILTEAFRSAGIMVGSPTINNGISHAMAAVMEGLKHLKLKKKQGAAFGAYGWSGEGPGILKKLLEDAGVAVEAEPIRQIHRPTPEDLCRLEAFGEAFVRGLQ